MNSLNATSASAISHWNVQKHLLLARIDAKRKAENPIDKLHNEGFYTEFAYRMGKSTTKFVNTIKPIFNKIIF